MTVSALLNFAGSLAVVWLTLAITSRLSGSLYAGIIGASFLLLQGSFLRYTMAGMETPLYTLLILCAFWYILLERYTWAAVMAGLAAVMRLDGLAVGGALFLAYLLHQRRLPWRALLVYLAILSPWLLFATLYFGSPLPHSMIAKQTHLKVYGHNRFWIWDYLFTNHYATPTTLLAMIPVGLLTLLQ
ncbi:MAG: hypothetical protein KDE47_28595, partial [Caldilineaceae bacterium]|nr:hypothetical protein [Caldilineaceae bacterium]